MYARQEHWWGDGAFPGLDPSMVKDLDEAFLRLSVTCRTEEEADTMWWGAEMAKVTLVEELMKKKREEEDAQKAKEDRELTAAKRARVVEALDAARIAFAEEAEAKKKADAVKNDAANIESMNEQMLMMQTWL